MTQTNWQWVSLDSFGFAYYECYVNPTNGIAYGWINRMGMTEPYNYVCYYADGTNTQIATRGSATNARTFIRQCVSQYKPGS